MCKSVYQGCNGKWYAKHDHWEHARGPFNTQSDALDALCDAYFQYDQEESASVVFDAEETE